MSVSRGKRHVVLALGFLFTALALGGCTSIKYSYDTRTSFPALKTYAWAPSSVAYYGGQDFLLESNVRDFADQTLRQKGFSIAADKPDLVISINYEPELGYSQYNYLLRMLTLNMFKPETKELVWRGTATGSIHTDAASGNLRHAVQEILSHFPPK